jgi:hypothetical protein
MAKTKADLEQEIVEKDRSIRMLKERIDVLYQRKTKRAVLELHNARKYSKHIELESAKVSALNSIAVSLSDINSILRQAAEPKNKGKKS